MTIGRICVQEVDLAYPHETARSAAQRMATRSVGTLVIVGAAHKPVGILTDRDLALRVVAAGAAPETVRVEEVMTRTVHTIANYLPIESACEEFQAVDGILRGSSPAVLSGH